MSNIDMTESLQIDDLNKIEKINGEELLLIQTPDSEETNCVSVDVFLANLARLLSDGQVISIAETDPTVPSYLKLVTKEELDSYNEAVKEVEILKKQMKALLEPTIDIVTFTSTPGLVELGTVLNTVTLKWSYNYATPVAQFLNDVELDINKRSKMLDGPFTSDQQFILTVNGLEDSKATRVINLRFLNGLYYGASKLTPITSEFINTFEHKLTDNLNLGFTVTPREQEYIYVAYPDRLGDPKFVITSEEADFELIETFEFTNKSGYTETYRVYRTTNVYLGQTTVRMSNLIVE